METTATKPALALEKGQEAPVHSDPEPGGLTVDIYTEGGIRKRRLCVIEGANVSDMHRGSHESRIVQVEVHGDTRDDEGDRRLIWRGDVLVSRITLTGNGYDLYGVLLRVGYQTPEEMADTSNTTYQGEWQDVNQRVCLEVSPRR